MAGSIAIKSLTFLPCGVLMNAMIRKWLRSLIGWEEVNAVLADVSVSLGDMHRYCTSLEALIQAQGKEIAELKGTAQLRARKPVAMVQADWETIQAAYAANVENYKES